MSTHPPRTHEAPRTHDPPRTGGATRVGDTTRTACLLVSATIVLAPTPAAQARSRRGKTPLRQFLDCGCYRETLYFSPGLTLAGAFPIPQTGTHPFAARSTSPADPASDFASPHLPHTPEMVLGGELSLVYLSDRATSLFGGVVADAVYDWHRGRGRAMCGAVFGWHYFGLDGGYLIDFDKKNHKHGGAVRIFASVGVLTFYLRYGLLKDSADFGELGLIIKLPLPIWAR